MNKTQSGQDTGELSSTVCCPKLRLNRGQLFSVAALRYVPAASRSATAVDTNRWLEESPGDAMLLPLFFSVTVRLFRAGRPPQPPRVRPPPPPTHPTLKQHHALSLSLRKFSGGDVRYFASTKSHLRLRAYSPRIDHGWCCQTLLFASPSEALRPVLLFAPIDFHAPHAQARELGSSQACLQAASDSI